ncbi:MAG: hypothetical protein FJX75_08505 [Armatimonadetes bacterium]|nr:hypothetical protein [Armatimonadota bacterium]MBM3957662.1 hypothetical protein [Gemmatimonadota bacterium]
MRSRSSKRIVRLAVATAPLCLFLAALAATQQVQEAVPQQGETEWLPVGAQTFTFGDDGSAVPPEAKQIGGTGGWPFYGPTGKPDVIVSSIQRKWLAAPADAASLTVPPKDRRLAVEVYVWFEPGGGGRWRYGRARLEVGFVDDRGRVTTRLEKHTRAAEAICISYAGRAGERLVLTFPEVPNALPVRGYIRADVVAASGYEPEDWQFPYPGFGSDD